MNPGTRPARSSLAGSSLADGSGPPGHCGHPAPVPPGLPGHADQVALARTLVAAALASCPAASDAILLTSELATNAVTHSATSRGGLFAVSISHAPGRVRVTVTDDGSATRPAVAVAVGDRLAAWAGGLLLVDCLARHWGFVTDPGEAPRSGSSWTAPSPPPSPPAARMAGRTWPRASPRPTRVPSGPGAVAVIVSSSPSARTGAAARPAP